MGKRAGLDDVEEEGSRSAPTRLETWQKRTFGASTKNNGLTEKTHANAHDTTSAGRSQHLLVLVVLQLPAAAWVRINLGACLVMLVATENLGFLVNAGWESLK